MSGSSRGDQGAGANERRHPIPGRMAAVILAGGAARRLGGRPKPWLAVDGVPLVLRVLDAAAAANPRIVVGALELVPLLPKGVSLTQESQAGAGPLAALATGLRLLRVARPGTVAVLASDLPLLTREVVAQLRAAASKPDVDGAVLVDEDGDRQWLAGVWRYAALVGAMPEDPANLGLRSSLSGLRIADVAVPTGQPWFDCDTEADLNRAAALVRDADTPTTRGEPDAG